MYDFGVICVILYIFYMKIEEKSIQTLSNVRSSELQFIKDSLDCFTFFLYPICCAVHVGHRFAIFTLCIYLFSISSRSCKLCEIIEKDWFKWQNSKWFEENTVKVKCLHYDEFKLDLQQQSSVDLHTWYVFRFSVLWKYRTFSHENWIGCMVRAIDVIVQRKPVCTFGIFFVHHFVK